MMTRSGRPPSQREDELRPFIELLRDHGVRSYLEIGARHGDTFHEVTMSLPPGSRGVAVDLPGGAWGVRSSRRSLDSAVVDLDMRGFDVTVLYGDSRGASVIETVDNLGPFDAVLIDGDHRLAGVNADWLNYGPMGKIVAFHDIAGDGVRQKSSGDPVEVPILWGDLKRSNRTVEFVGEGSKMGIGVILR